MPSDAIPASAFSVAGTAVQRLDADRVDSWGAARERWAALTERADALPFQRLPWLDAWFRHCAGPGIDPAIVFLQAAGRDVIGLPLVRIRERGKRVVTFADAGLTDYNAPAVATGFAAPDDRSLWRSLRRALPSADVLRLEKMPTVIDDRPNPLAGLPRTTPSTLIGNILHVPGTWDEWHWGLERTFRKELERSSRVFEKHPGAAFRRYGAGPEGAHIYGELKRLQAARIAELGLPYILGEAPAGPFYDDLVEKGLADCTAVLTALTIGDEVVAALLGITDGRHYCMTRLATPGPQWKNFSPGRMVIERTMKMLHAEGFHAFDFTIGDYAYKRRIGVTPVPMVEAVMALSPLGLLEVAAARAKALVKRHPRLLALAKAFQGADRQAEPHASSQ